jgi:hypothetical protein
MSHGMALVFLCHIYELILTGVVGDASLTTPPQTPTTAARARFFCVISDRFHTPLPGVVTSG